SLYATCNKSFASSLTEGIAGHMNPKSYNIIFLLLHALIVGILIFAYRTLNLDQDGEVSYDAARIVGFIIVGAIIALLSYMTKFAYHLLVLQQIHHRLQGIPSSYESFYQPIIEESIKFAIIIWFQHIKFDRALNAFELSLVWCGFIILSLKLYFYNPRGYSQKYDRFLAYYQSWIVQMKGERSEFAEENYRASRVWTTLVSGNIDMEMHDKKPGRSTIASQKRHVDGRALRTKLSSKMLPTEFNLKSNPDKYETACFPKGNICAPIQLPVTNDTSCSKTVERLYSVSPKDTYHLITAVASATFGDGEGIERFQGENYICCTEAPSAEAITQDLLPGAEEVFENIDDSFCQEESLNEDDLPAHEHFIPDLSTRNYGSHNTNAYKQSVTTIVSSDNFPGAKLEQSMHMWKLRGLAFINWWSWLCPPLLPIHQILQQKTSGPLCLSPSHFSVDNERFPLLKSKLSSYSLNDRTQDESVHDQDLINDKSIARVLSFEIYLSYYFDITLSPILHPFPLDQWFMTHMAAIHLWNNWAVHTKPSDDEVAQAFTTCHYHKVVQDELFTGL
ncbi:hypothetical protein KGF57_001255, partial [Candida theae]